MSNLSRYTIDLTAPNSYPVVGVVVKIKGRRLFEGQENSDVREWLKEENDYDGEGGWFKNASSTNVKKTREIHAKSSKKLADNNANHFAVLGEKTKSLRQAGRTAREIGEISARLRSENTTSTPLTERTLPSWLGSGIKPITRGLPKKAFTADQRVTKSEMKNLLKHQGAKAGITDTAANARIVRLQVF